MKLYLDPGHGGNDPGAQGNGINEKDVTLDIALKIRTILSNNYENIEIKMSRTSDSTKSLSQRTSEANSWGADYYLAIHINAFNGTAQGYEDYIYSNLADSSATAKYRDIIHAEVIKLNQLKDRGKKKANFHVLRESSMPAFLSENGFIDHPHDAALMKQDSWRQKVAQGHANGIAKAFNLKAKSKPIPTPSPEPTPTGYSILGPTYLSPEHMDLFVKTVNPNAIDLGHYYLTFGEYYGIRGDIAFAQALHETNYFRFTGTVKPEQNNFAGIGTTGPDNPGASFATPKEGVLAHLQHLFAYASTQALPTQYPLVDPRFNLVKRGSAPTWTALNGKWAVPGTTYGQSILSLYGKMVSFAKQNLDTILEEIND